MDLDKILLFISKLGFPVAVAVWLAWEFHTFMSTLVSQNTTVIKLLEELIRIH